MRIRGCVSGAVSKTRSRPRLHPSPRRPSTASGDPRALGPGPVLPVLLSSRDARLQPAAQARRPPRAGPLTRWGGGEGPRAAAPRGACSCLGGRRWRREHQVIPTGARVTGDARPGCCPTRRRSFPDHRREKTILLLVTGCLPSPLKDMVTSSLLAPDRGLCRRDPAGRVTWRLVRRTLTWGGRRPR